jgi:hypothetical protein
VLRGVALRGGSYTDVANVIPLTAAPATETSRPHQSFNSDVFYPNQVWMPNFYDAVHGGSTRLVTVPAQYRSSSPGSIDGTMRTFSDLDLALYYMPADWTGPGSPASVKAAGVSAGPSITGVSASLSGTTVTFSVNAQSDGSAGMQTVWVLYTADPGSPFYGRWAPVDLVQSDTDAALWTGTLDIAGTDPSSVRFMVHAVNGAGLTALATNLGGYYSVAPATPPPPPATPTITLTAPTSGTYLTPQQLSARVTNGAFGPGIAGQTLVFDIGGQQAATVTDEFGEATVTITPAISPGPYTAQVSSKPNVSFTSATASQPFTLIKAGTELVASPPAASVASGAPSGVRATLTTDPDRGVDGKSVTFVVTGGPTPVVRVVSTDNTGVAPLPALSLPAGTYSVKAYFGGGAVGGVAGLELPDDENYSSSSSNTVSLTVTAAPVLSISVQTRNADNTAYTPGTWTNQNVTVDFTCMAGVLPIVNCQPDRTISNGIAPASVNTVTDTGGNTATVNVGEIKVDTELPTATITSPTTGASFTAGTAVNAAYACTDVPSGIATCAGTVAAGQPIDTATPGAKSFVVTATDLAGNVTQVSVAYTVISLNQAPVVRADMGVSGLQEIGYKSNAVVLSGSFTDADGSGPYKASVRWTPTGNFTSFVLNNNSDFVAAFIYPSAGTRVVTVRVCDKLGACGTDDVTVRTSVTQKVTPVRECVVDRGSRVTPRYQARFGYSNPAPFAIYVPTLPNNDNTFTSSPYFRGQPQVFLPGVKSNVFTTTFNSGSISWKLNGTTVTAKSSSPRC